MSLYEKLDIIADSYNPILLILSIVIILVNIKRNRKVYAFYEFVLLTVLISLVYLFQAIDNRLSIWSSFGCNYSTHTAFSLAIVFFVLFKGIKTKAYIVTSFVFYIALMLFQKYHTIIDILTTIAAISPLMYTIVYFSNKQLANR